MENLEVIKSDLIRESGCITYAIFDDMAVELSDIIGVHMGKTFNVRPLLIDGHATAVINNGRMELLCLIAEDGHWQIGPWPRTIRDAREVC